MAPGYHGFVATSWKNSQQRGKLDHVLPLDPARDEVYFPLTKNISPTVSMSPLTVDSTGMCGCCRADGKLRFAWMAPVLTATDLDIDRSDGQDQDGSIFFFEWDQSSLTLNWTDNNLNHWIGLIYNLKTMSRNNRRTSTKCNFLEVAGLRQTSHQ